MVRKTTVARSAYLFLALIAGPGDCLAQFWGAINPVGESGQGFRLYQLQGSASYFSNALPPGYYLRSQPNLGYDVGYGGSATAGYSQAGTRSAFSAVYAVNYSGRTQYSQFDAWNHSFTLGWRRKLGRKWSATLAANADLLTSTALLSVPTSASSLAAAPATFDEFAAAVLSGNYANSQLASILTAAPLPAPAAQLQFYGYRSLATAVVTSITYAHSSRLSISANAAGGRSQHISSSADRTSSGAPAYFLPTNTWVTSSLSMSYSLTPRTQISLSGSGTRVVSYLADTYTAQGSGSIGHIMGRRWFLQASAGSGYIFAVKGIGGSSGTGYTAGGSIGYKTFASTFVASYAHTLGNNYGLGGYATEAASGAWHWARPGWSWSASVSGGWQQSSDLLYPSLDSWNVSAALSRQFGVHTSASLQYGYMNVQLPDAQTYKLNGVSLILAWSPNRRPAASSPSSSPSNRGLGTP